MARVSGQLHHFTKLKKFQYRDCCVYIVHSVLCSPHGLSVPSIFHSLHISSANPASLPQPCTDYLIFTLLKRPSMWASLHHRISVFPHISPACLFSQGKVTLVLFKINQTPTSSHRLQKLFLLLVLLQKSLHIHWLFPPSVSVYSFRAQP